ncbi:MAG: MFS transporter [Rhodobiaceae bacterium]|nr:MFS transporter [Rhodobiaceae bacterium]MCC0056007.1 MFS transporter [Rhodobiaceae bacterium]
MNTTAKSGEHPYGWVIVIAATICMIVSFGANLTVSVLIKPFETEFGWSRGEISLAYTMVTIGGAFGGLFWGALSDKIGAKKIAFVAGITLPVALMGVSFQSNLYAIYALYLVIGGIGFAGMFTPLLTLTGQWFEKRRGMAMGIATAGGAFGQGFIPFLARVLISEYDWRTAMMVLGVGSLVLILPALFLLRPPPKPVHAAHVQTAVNAAVEDHSDNSWKLPWTVTIPWIAAAGFFCCVCMAVPLMHVIPLATDIGITPETAAGLLFALMMAGIVGRIVFGSLADRIGALYTYVITSLGQTVSVFLFVQTGSVAALFAIAIFFGFFYAGVMTGLLICAQEAAPARRTGFAMAVVSMTGWGGMGVGGWQAGYFFDTYGNYTTSYATAAIAGIINLMILAALIWYRKDRQPTVRFARA